MNYKTFDKILLLICAVIVFIQALLLITHNNPFALNIEFGLFEALSIIFWIVMALNIGALISTARLKE